MAGISFFADGSIISVGGKFNSSSDVITEADRANRPYRLNRLLRQMRSAGEQKRRHDRVFDGKTLVIEVAGHEQFQDMPMLRKLNIVLLAVALARGPAALGVALAAAASDMLAGGGGGRAAGGSGLGGGSSTDAFWRF